MPAAPTAATLPLPDVSDNVSAAADDPPLPTGSFASQVAQVLLGMASSRVIIEFSHM